MISSLVHTQARSADNFDKLACFSTHHSCSFKTARGPNVPAKSNAIAILILSYKVLISRHFHKKSTSRRQNLECQQLLCHVAFIQRRLETSTFTSEPAMSLRHRFPRYGGEGQGQEARGQRGKRKRNNTAPN